MLRCHGANVRGVARGHAGEVAGTADASIRAIRLRLVRPEANRRGESADARPTQQSLANRRLLVLAIQEAMDAILTWVAPPLLTVQRTG